MKTYCTSCGKLSDSKETKCPSCGSVKIPVFNPLTKKPDVICGILNVIAILVIAGGILLFIIFLMSNNEDLGLAILPSALITALFIFAISNALHNIAVASTKCEQIKFYMSILAEAAIPNIDETLSSIEYNIKDKT